MFLKKYENEYSICFTENQERMLKFISTKFGNAKRPHELLLIKCLLRGVEHPLWRTKEILENEFDLPYEKNAEENVINIATGRFASGSGAKVFQDCVLIQKSGPHYRISDEFSLLLEDKDFHQVVEELVDFALFKNKKYYSNYYEDTSSQLYSKYTYSDVCRLLNWERDHVPINIGGYRYDEKTKTYPVFINYEKAQDISSSINYEDRFISNSAIIAISKSQRTIQSEDVQRAINAEKLGISMHLFIRKNKDDRASKEFYYLGKIKATGELEEFTMPKTDVKAVEIFYDLDVPVRDDIYDYIIS